MKRLFSFIILLTFVFNVYANYRASSNGKAFIKDKEKCSLTAYYDSNGYSIGYGHHSKNVKKGSKITMEQANKYFAQDIKVAEESVNRLLKGLPYKYKFSQDFIDGFVSFVYNCGEGGAKSSLFYSRLKRCRVRNGKMNKQDYDFALASIKTSRISCNGHKARRMAEYKLMRG